MRSVNLAAAKAHPSKLVEEAATGNPVCITRRGKPVAQITAMDRPRKAFDVAALRALTGTMPMQSESAGEFMRRLREDERY